ncbi:thiamine pyrophosphokinase [Mucilaginibacter ginkgonis]|uniref:Thiamine pyrophosphokinase n=1 Tax=Mucilaginibacter ginkgonis TaxID=2682091 RepID=A0A6I4I1F0_9SPHI|nr:thiamine pyrophosphokinase [Mucilaginibacter ginkgonis]QQL48957.1 thiamine pyrophosphokinase [Mucilaginibacter ginkgonis]
MSSHHIVREKQEPALLVLGLDGFSMENLGQLLEWSPTVIATADTFDQLISQEIKVDWLIGDATANMQDNIETIVASDPLSLALNELISREYGAVNIVGDVVVDELKDFISQINIVIYSANQKIYPVRSGFQKWLPAGESICIIGKAEGLSVRGLVPVHDGHYRTEADGMVTIRFTGDYLFISELI